MAYGAELRVRHRVVGRRRSTRPITQLVSRRRLDALLVEHALSAGATLIERAPVREVRLEAERALVRAGDHRFEAACVVAADGAHGRAARLGGLALHHHQGLAIEGNLPASPRVRARFDDCLSFDLGVFPGGYGWLFPKGDHVNIGVGGWSFAGRSLKAELMKVVRAYGFDPSGLRGVRGHGLTVRRSGAPLATGRLVLVGDAAGLVDPLIGEGLHTALASGRIAAKHIAALLSGRSLALDAYAREIRERVEDEHAIALQLHDLAQTAPMACALAFAHLPLMWDLGTRVLRGELSLVAIRQRFGPLGTALEGAARWAGRYRESLAPRSSTSGSPDSRR